MRILAACFQCADTDNKPALVYGQLEDSGIARIVCDAGHESYCVTSLELFEYLFESGLLAYAHGFEREAVASFSASLERFFEYYVRVISRKNTIDQNAFDQVWKNLANLSERQLGAFLLVHLLETGRAFMVSQKMIEFRNKVMHKGYIPSMTEVRDYVDFVYETIVELRKYLESEAEDCVSQLRRELLVSRSQAVDASCPRSTMGTVVSLSIVDGDALSLDGQLKQLRDSGVSFVPSTLEVGDDA